MTPDPAFDDCEPYVDPDCYTCGHWASSHVHDDANDHKCRRCHCRRFVACPVEPMPRTKEERTTMDEESTMKAIVASAGARVEIEIEFGVWCVRKSSRDTWDHGATLREALAALLARTLHDDARAAKWRADDAERAAKAAADQIAGAPLAPAASES